MKNLSSPRPHAYSETCTGSRTATLGDDFGLQHSTNWWYPEQDWRRLHLERRVIHLCLKYTF